LSRWDGQKNRACGCKNKAAQRLPNHDRTLLFRMVMIENTCAGKAVPAKIARTTVAF
jgi:hypothetical protein